MQFCLLTSRPLLVRSAVSSPNGYGSDELILEAFAAYGDKLALSDLPLDVRYGVEQCQAFLQAAMRENQNQYELVVTGVFGDYGTPTAGGTGTTEAVITIVFPDGTRAEMHYYGHHLDVCQEISD
jgi:hypothetical protein